MQIPDEDPAGKPALVELKKQEPNLGPTPEEIAAEVARFIAAKPSQVTIKPPGEPPTPGGYDPREGGGWKTPQHEPAPGFKLPPMPNDDELPPGYTWA